MTRQLEMFIQPTSPIVGVFVRLDPDAARTRACCDDVCVIASGKEPHAAELRCAKCDRHRGWLSKFTARWIEDVATRFGAPTTPIAIRRRHFRPPTDDGGTMSSTSCSSKQKENADAY